MKNRTIALTSILALSMGVVGCGAAATSAPSEAEVQTTEDTAVEEVTTEENEAEKDVEDSETSTITTDAVEDIDTADAEESTDDEAESDDASSETGSTDPESPDYVIELDPQYNVPTEELLKSFPIEYQTPAATELSQKIQNRMLNGFNRWNMGYDAWEHWGEVLYHDDSIYNVNGVKLTLKEYQQAMDVSLKSLDIQMGTFKNMVLVDDWMAIQYDIVNIDRETGEEHPGTTMEFAKFGDYGELGAKVDEGWGGVKNDSYQGTMYFQTEEEQAAQKEFMEELMNTELEDTDDLEAKYPVVYPTTIDTELGEKMKDAILNDFENWNQGYDAWNTWTDTFYTDDVAMNYLSEDISMDDYKAVVCQPISDLFLLFFMLENYSQIQYFQLHS